MSKHKILILVFLFSSLLVNAQNNNIGNWDTDNDGLPKFEYTGSVPYSSILSNGDKVNLPSDPWFLLGNYRLTLFTHVSGNYQIITGEREWGRLNQGGKIDTGSNSSTLKISGKSNKNYQLTGLNSISANTKQSRREFGCGYAEYTYDLDEVRCIKNFSVKPSTTPYNGTSAFLISITLENKSGKNLSMIYTESVTSNYVPMKQQKIDISKRIINTESLVKEISDQKILVAVNTTKSSDPYLYPTDPSKMSQYDGYPPSLFMKVVDTKINSKMSTKKNELGNELIAKFQVKLKPNESRTFQLVIGYTFDTNESTINKMADNISSSIKGANKFANDWKKILPDFKDEKDLPLKNEMIWNAYNLEAMATYSDYYKETKIPQGTNYAYDLGIHASIRDNFQHALPLTHYNTELAKSVMKYMMKRTTPQGRFRLIEWGHGYSSSWYFYTSDQQLFSFMYLAEYLRATKDYNVLNEKSSFFPFNDMKSASILDWVEAQFIFLRDDVSTGDHGLVRLLNADWNDFVYHVVKEPYNNVLYTGESHMNSAMAVSILDDLIPQLEEALKQKTFKENDDRVNLLIKSMSMYRDKIADAFVKDMGNRKFPRRLYFNGKAYGEDNMFLEPQGYALQMKELSYSQKQTLYAEMQQRVYKNEKIGARQQQDPEFESEEYEKGSRENGGVWWALNGPVILGVSQFDKPEAWRLLKNMTRENFMKEFPNYWSSYWSLTDNFESSLMPGEGLPDQTVHMSDIPVFCAHSHAWPLYCYYRLKE